MKKEYIRKRFKADLKNVDRFKYMLLSRLQSDFEYYFGNGNRNKNSLYCNDFIVQYRFMIELYNTLKIKPKWINPKTIRGYKNLNNAIITR